MTSIRPAYMPISSEIYKSKSPSKYQKQLQSIIGPMKVSNKYKRDLYILSLKLANISKYQLSPIELVNQAHYLLDPKSAKQTLKHINLQPKFQKDLNSSQKRVGDNLKKGAIAGVVAGAGLASIPLIIEGADKVGESISSISTSETVNQVSSSASSGLSNSIGTTAKVLAKAGQSDKGKEILSQAGEMAKEAGSQAVDGIKKASSALYNTATSDQAKEIGGSILGVAKNTGESIIRFATSDTVKSIFSNISQIGKRIFASINIESIGKGLFSITKNIGKLIFGTLSRFEN